LAIVFQNRILHAPKLRGKIKTNQVTIDFCNERIYGILLAVLRGKMPPDYNFYADPAVRVCYEKPEE
ncbi:MAG: hypothetical protein PHF00_13505, partial [Elusimicrobia bacterium]|nr:hypothetical protein [Elusimicrobiota bacterium]